jgi:hypothetical protein
VSLQIINLKTDCGALGSPANDTNAFILAAVIIQTLGGGQLEIPFDNYIVGKQTFAGVAGLGYAYNPSQIFAVTGCTKPIVINGNGSVIKIATGLRFGAFDAVTGLAASPAMPYYGEGKAALGTVFDFQKNSAVSLRDLEIDGNIANQVIGGYWGDTGRQLTGSGASFYGNGSVSVENVQSHHHCLDGFVVGHTGLLITDPVRRPHIFTNCKSLYNGRQGLSWVGGNHLYAENCDFSETGKNGFVSSAPGAGLDIEAESSICRNGVFVNCTFADNTGCGLVADSGDSADCQFYNCKFIGTTNWALWAKKPGFKYFGCKIVGSAVNIYGSATEPEKASQFHFSDFSHDVADSPTGVIYGQRQEFGGCANVLMSGCTFRARGVNQLPFSDYGPNGMQYDNCAFSQSGTVTYYTRGVFTGCNKFTAPAATLDSAGSIFYGATLVNGVAQYVTTPPALAIAMLANNGAVAYQVHQGCYYDPVAFVATLPGGVTGRGAVVWNANAVAGGQAGWICITAPGTSAPQWKTFGAISP